MPYGKGTYGSKVGRPTKKKKTLGRGVAKLGKSAKTKKPKPAKGRVKPTPAQLRRKRKNIRRMGKR